MSIAKRITDTRTQRGVTKSGLARLVDVTPSAVNAWEAGRAEPRGPTLHKIARVLGVDPAYLEHGGRTAAPSSAQDAVHAATPAQIIDEARARLAALWQTTPDKVEIKATMSH